MHTPELPVETCLPLPAPQEEGCCSCPFSEAAAAMYYSAHPHPQCASALPCRSHRFCVWGGCCHRQQCGQGAAGCVHPVSAGRRVPQCHAGLLQHCPGCWGAGALHGGLPTTAASLPVKASCSYHLSNAWQAPSARLSACLPVSLSVCLPVCLSVNIG